MNVPWLRLGSQTDIATAPPETTFMLEDGFVVAKTAARPDYWFGNYAIVPAAASEHILTYADALLRHLPRASRDIVVWETSSCKIAHVLPSDVEYARRSVMACNGRCSFGGAHAAVRIEDDAGWRAVFDLIVAEAEGTPEFWWWYVRAMRARCERGDGVWWAIEREGAVVSTLGLMDAGGGTSRFAHIVTAAQHRRRGYAGALIRRAMAHEAANSRFVVVAEMQSAAERLYEAIGFRTVSWQHVVMRERK